MSRWCLIVATYGRALEVDILLNSLARLHSENLRIILVDQNTDGRLEAIVATWAGRLQINHLITLPRGVSHARNIGLAHLGDAEFVAFPDDDCRYEPDTLVEAERAFAADANAQVLISNWYGIDTPRPPAPAKNHPRQTGQIGALRQSPTYTLFFRRSAVDLAGGFDESLGPGGGTPWLCGEDADYLLRAGALANHCRRAPAVLVSHPQVEFTGHAGKAHGYGRGRMRVLRKHSFPLWFQLASIIQPLLQSVLSSGHARRFRWHLFRGRLHEFIAPYRPQGSNAGTGSPR